MLVAEKGGGQRIFDIEKTIVLTFSLLRNDDVGDIYAVDSQRSLTSLVGGGEAAEDGKAVSSGGSVEERVLHMSATLCVAIGLVTE